MADEAAKKFLPAQQVEQIQRRASEIKARVAPDLPAGVTAELRPYQLEGFHFLAYLSTNRFGGILADDMGLGKTLQTLAWLVWLREQGQWAIASARSTRDSASTPALPSLVVCPKSVMDNWHAEAARFTPGLRVKSGRRAKSGGFGERARERRSARAQLQPAPPAGREPGLAFDGRRSSSTKGNTSRTPTRKPPRPPARCGPITASRSPARPSRTACSISGV